MLYRPIQRRSEAAEWGRRFGALSLPVLVLTILGHRFYGMSTEHAFALVAVSVGFGLLGILLSVVGIAVVWERGHLGGGSAVRGLIYGLIAMAPAGFGLWGVYTYPRFTDISTDIADPPLYRNAAFVRVGRFNTARPPDTETLARQRAAYPDIVTRRFTIGSDQLYLAARKVVERLGWRISEDLAPKDETDRARIEAVARTLLFGFEDDVVVRIYSDPSGSRIDLRSSSRWGDHDLGANARRIRDFFTELDAAVVEAYGQ
ncbi:DUF1499 domain-containing protein [Prosthecodimorpha staleyi]|uniref:DUF1499 domain-containing protein n=1 Tax=Prosthecodimorpha staleyi TaxID=2840188 RepID=A0A947D0B1_9HYPH|nr:DUF1499 domain-containing protein [Prosthecodimorpha staleyi]MBT9288400.1 DUF1499 domain-containing protein [Prosthecodimorpha staleyi]